MNHKHMNNDEDAQVGIGTMIVFIATILVAAVAAGVLIDTSQKLQDKSTKTGNDAISDVASSLTIQAIYGYERTATDAVREMQLMVSLAPGADPVDLQDLIIQFTDGTRLLEFTWFAEGGDPDAQGAGTGAFSDFTELTFWADVIRDSDNSVIDFGVDTVFNDHAAAADDVYTGVMNEDDIVLLSFAKTTNVPAYLDLGTSVKATTILLPDTGIATELSFTTPISMSTGSFWELA